MPEAVLQELAYVNIGWAGQVKQSDEVIAAAAEALGKQHEGKITATDVAAIEQEIRIKCAGAPPAEVDAIIRDLQANIGTSKRNLDDIRKGALDAAAKLADDVKQEAVQTPDEKFNSAWNKIQELSEKAKERFDQIPTNEEEKNKQKELEEKVREAEKNGDKHKMLNAQIELLAYYEKMGIKYDDPELVKRALEARKEAEKAKESMVGEALVYVQGASPKTSATFPTIGF